MKKLFAVFSAAWLFVSCTNQSGTPVKENKKLAGILESYYNERMSLFPLEATANGEKGFNDKLYIEFTDSYQGKTERFFFKIPGLAATG